MIEVTVNPDEKHILAATHDEVILQGYIGDDCELCVLIVSRPAYHAAIHGWLDGKAEYFRDTKEFAGVGSILFSAQPVAALERSCFLYDDMRDKTIPVPAYSAETFTVDMEHG